MNLYRVMFLCNDDRGDLTGFVDQVEIGDEVLLVAPTRSVFRVLPRQQIKIGRSYYAFRGDMHYWVGNVFWNAVSMRFEEAYRLAARLVIDKWSVEQHADDGPFRCLLP